MAPNLRQSGSGGRIPRMLPKPGGAGKASCRTYAAGPTDPTEVGRHGRERKPEKPRHVRERPPLAQGNPGRFFPLLACAAALGSASWFPRGTSPRHEFLIQPLEGNPYNPTGPGSDLTNLETEAQVAASDVVTGDVWLTSSLEYRRDNLSRFLGVQVASNTQIVQITYRGSNKDLIAAVANQYAASYLAYRESRRDGPDGGQGGQLTSRIADLNRPAEELQAKRVRRRNTPVAGRRRPAPRPAPPTGRARHDEPSRRCDLRCRGQGGRPGSSPTLIIPAGLLLGLLARSRSRLPVSDGPICCIRSATSSTSACRSSARARARSRLRRPQRPATFGRGDDGRGGAQPKGRGASDDRGQRRGRLGLDRGFCHDLAAVLGRGEQSPSSSLTPRALVLRSNPAFPRRSREVAG